MLINPKMVSGSNDQNIPQDQSLQIKQDDKFFSRLMSKESSKANSSSRVYYGGASGSVPFTWESQPGTPKHTLFNDNCTLPPLTPPPSYQSISKSNTLQKSDKPNNTNSLLSNIFPRLIRSKKNHIHGSPSSSSSWSCTSSSSSFSSSSHSSTSKKSKFYRRNFTLTRLPMNMHFGMDGEDADDEDDLGSPTSTLCFIGHNKRRSLSKNGGCYSMMKMKKALVAIVVGHGSGQGTAA